METRSLFLTILILLVPVYQSCTRVAEKQSDTSFSQGNYLDWSDLAPPDTGKVWIQPAKDKPALPIWGHSHGIAVGISPVPGPRGLLKIFTPYLGLEQFSVINYMAVEPIASGESGRGLSELEFSALDNQTGKRFWSSNDSIIRTPGNEFYPVQGTVNEDNGLQVLTVFIFVEEFKNGAKVYLRLRFFEDRPHEFEITTYTCPESKPLDFCIVTATMGNRTRLRTLYLDNHQISSVNIWPDYNDSHFSPHASFPLKEMVRDRYGRAYFVAAPNEMDLQAAEYHPNTAGHWKYEGVFATQYWICEKPSPELMGQVNGRYVYWASTTPIPGGVSFENFELKEPFRNGIRFVYGVTPLAPEKFIEGLSK